MGDDPYGRFPDQGRSDTCDVPQFYQGWGLPELKLDRSAAPDTETSYFYLAVDPEMQHHGIAAKLLDETITYAQEHHMMISLETHNEKNVDFYKNFGFQVYGIVEKNFPLKQYCLIREYQ